MEEKNEKIYPFKKLLREHNVSQAEAARILGVSQSKISLFCKLSYPITRIQEIQLNELKARLGDTRFRHRFERYVNFNKIEISVNEVNKNAEKENIL